MPEETTPATQDNKDNSTDSRKATIEKALTDVENNKETSSSAKEEPTITLDKTKAKVEDKEDKGKNLEEEVTDDEVAEMDDAIRLFRALNDPKQAPIIVKAMAEKAGLLEAETKKEVKEIKKSIKQVVKERFGNEFAFLADKLGEVLEEIVPSATAEKTRELEEKIAAREREAVSKEVEKALNEVYSQYEIVPKTVQARFNELIDEMPPVPGKTDPKKYFNRLVKIAAEETNTTLKLVNSSAKNTNNSQKDRIERNKRDAASSLASESAGEVENVTQVQNFKTRRDAIKAAMAKVAEAE